MTYTLTVLVSLPVKDDDDAKHDARLVLKAMALLNQGHVIHFDKLGIRLEREDGSEVDLPYPEFPKGQRVP